MSSLHTAVRTRAGWRLLILASVLASALAGCTQLPVTEFNSYREAFTSARTSGEKILLDYDATKPKRAAVEKAAAAAKAAGVVKAPAVRAGRPVWTAVAATKDAEGADAIEVRLAAWKIVADYNEALLALVEGKSAAELSGALGDLASGLQSFPWASLGDKVAKMAGSVGGIAGPAVQVVTDLAVEFRREQDRQMFLKAVAEASPLIDGFITLLHDDLGDFATNRALLFDFERTRTMNALASKLGEFGQGAANLEDALTSAGDTEGAGGVSKQRAGIDAKIRQLREYAADGVGAFTGGAEVADPGAQQRRLDGLEADIDQIVQTALAQDREMDAYDALLSGYLKLLNQLSVSTHKLRDASRVAASERVLPPTENLLALATQMRRAIETYEKAR